MKKFVRSRSMGIGHYVTCPFCPDRRDQALNEAMPWCSSCGCEYRITPCGAVFDQELKTPRYVWGKALNLADVWGKALNLAGGTRIGKVDK